MLRLMAILLGLLCFAVPSRSSAQEVGLAPFSGPRHRVIRRVVRAALEERVTVVDLDSEDPGGADAVLTGATRGPRSRPRLTLVLLSRDGDELARQVLRVAQNRRGERAIGRAVRSLLDEAGDFAAAETPSSSGDEVPPDPYGPADEPSEPSEPAAEPARPRPTSASASANPYLHLLVGLSLRNREFSAQLGGATEVRNVIRLFPELLGEARIRPMVGSGDPLLEGIRLRVRFGYALFFESATPSGQVIGGAAWSLEGDAAWLAQLLDDLELGVSVGGGYATYGLDDNAFVPTVNYGSFEARAVTRVRAIGEELVIRAEAGYRYANGSGPTADRYGSIDGHGVVFEGGFEGIYPFDTNVALSWMAAIEWQNAWLSFSGTASDQLANGGSDGFIRARFAVGLALR